MNVYITENEAVYSAFMFLAGLLMDVLVLWVYCQWVGCGRISTNAFIGSLKLDFVVPLLGGCWRFIKIAFSLRTWLYDSGAHEVTYSDRSIIC